MALSRPEEILAALAEQKPGRLLGTPESSQIDFKKQPYDLETDKGKWELGKDVAGLANLGGGLLVVGVRTEKTPGNFLEVAVELRPVPACRLDREKYHSITRDLVRPAVIFEISYFPDPDETDKGYMCIRVEPLDEADRWALVRRMVNNDDKLVDSIGVPIRDSDQTRWLSADEVYQHLRDGQRAARAILSGPSSDSPAVRAPQQPGSVELLDSEDSLQRLISFKDWESPILAWQSRPTRPIDLSMRMWGTGSISQILRNASSSRQWGFNWSFMTEPTPFDNGSLASDGRHAIWIQENGLITAATPVKADDMLTWAMRNPPEGPYRLNLVALVEMTLEYYRLVDEFILPDLHVPYMHLISTKKFAEDPGVILPSTLPSAIPLSEHRASRDVRQEFPATRSPEHDAYQVLARLYGTFQFGPEVIPFTTENRIDAQKLLEYIRIHP